ncbi:MAG: glycosyltransferase family 4 protein, partial [Verrucomicrobia bacterium]|nr:glycosyltransferase family 4 protein [Verrucomicrobiota bacterium]
TDGVVCITRYTQQAVSGDGVRTWVVPNAVDKEFFPIVPAPEAQPLILCVGHVTVRKNQNAFIQAMDALATRLALRSRFIGLAAEGDPYAEEFKRLAATRPWVEHINWADRAEVRTHFQKASLLVLPTLEDNCPMVVLEAMAAGVPVMAANVGGVPDLIENGETGLLCNPLDEAGMTNATERLLRDRELAGVLAENARRKAFATYHPTVVARQHLQIYRELLLSK